MLSKKIVYKLKSEKTPNSMVFRDSDNICDDLEILATIKNQTKSKLMRLLIIEILTESLDDEDLTKEL